MCSKIILIYAHSVTRNGSSVNSLSEKSFNKGKKTTAVSKKMRGSDFFYGGWGLFPFQIAVDFIYRRGERDFEIAAFVVIDAVDDSGRDIEVIENECEEGEVRRGFIT